MRNTRGGNNNQPAGLYPIQIETESAMNRLGVFLTEHEAIDYIQSIEGAFGPYTIIKTYER